MDLPVRRPKPKEKQIVLAFPDELDNWVRQQTKTPGRLPDAQPNLTARLLADAMQMYRSPKPLLELNRDGLQRMHALLAEMVQRTQLVHARAEDLMRNVRQCRDFKGTPTSPIPPVE
jgi:hypothetical protein